MDTPTASSSSSSTGTSVLRPAFALTVLSATAVALGGVKHLSVWNSNYREIPDGVVPGLWVVKVGFPLQAAASVVVAVVLVAVAFGLLGSLRRLVLGVALALQVGSIVALVASRGPGIFGWTETGYEGKTLQILVIEVVASVVLVAALAVGSGRDGAKKS